MPAQHRELTVDVRRAYLACSSGRPWLANRWSCQAPPARATAALYPMLPMPRPSALLDLHNIISTGFELPNTNKQQAHVANLCILGDFDHFEGICIINGF